MRVDQGTVHAPEIGPVWLNSAPLSFRQLRGRVVLVDFRDYTCIHCIRTLSYVQSWHERYRDQGLTVMGVHSPEFTFAQYESNVERGIREFGPTYPIVLGRWASTLEYLEAAEDGPHTLKLQCESAAVKLVMASPCGSAVEVVLLQDGKPLTRQQTTRDPGFRSIGARSGEESYILVDSARIYFLLDDHEYGRHELELRCSPGVAAFAFTFTSCVDPLAGALAATAPTL